MPGFYEHDEEDTDLGMNAGAADDMEGEDNEQHQTHLGEIGIPQTRPRPPVSAPARTNSTKKTSAVASASYGPRISTKPHSTSHVTRPSETSPSRMGSKSHAQSPLPSGSDAGATTVGMLECPICGKTLETDNQGLNSHIDFCLSRGAIMAAQTVAENPTKGFKSCEKNTIKSGNSRRKKG